MGISGKTKECMFGIFLIMTILWKSTVKETRRGQSRKRGRGWYESKAMRVRNLYQEDCVVDEQGKGTGSVGTRK